MDAAADLRAAWRDQDRLVDAQAALALATPPAWQPGPGPLLGAGCFVAFARGEQGPGHRGDHGWGGAALAWDDGRPVATMSVPGTAGAAYGPGLLAAREGDLLAAALDALPQRPDVLLVDATGRDHPRRAGLALHLGAALGLPSVGVTHRPLTADGPLPGNAVRGTTAPLRIGGDEVARWVVTQDGVQAIVAHAAWRTDLDTAVEVVLRFANRFRTPEPLRLARCAAREARSRAG